MPNVESTLPTARTLAGRLWIYQRERFPLVAHGLLVAVLSAAALGFSSLARGAPLPSPALWISAFVTALGFFFQLRVYDEFKDAADDARARPYRPVPRGLVTLRELAWLAVGVAALQAALTIRLGLPLVGLLLAVWIYMALMGREFFAPAWLKARPLLYMLSHMVITPLIVLYLTACDWLAQGAPPPPGLAWFLALGFANGLVFELGRKIRAPADEEAGVETYSALWGLGRALIFWWTAMAAAALCAVMAARALDLTLLVTWPAGLLWLGGLGAGLRLLRSPVAGRGKWVEHYAGIWMLLIYIGLGILPLFLPG